MSGTGTRRQFLVSLVSLGAAALPYHRARSETAAEDAAILGPPRPFDPAEIVARARDAANGRYAPPHRLADDLLARLDFDAMQKISNPAERSLWPDGAAFPVRFFHPHKFAPTPVELNVVENGAARRVRFRKSLFDYRDPELARQVPDSLGFAGFRVMDGPEKATDWLSFQGASYFRSAGDLKQYGASARAIAIDTAVDGTQEEFPRFSAFWIERPSPDATEIVIHALLDGPSIAGAFRIAARRDGGVATDVEATVFARRTIEHLGIAPLTSMFWYAERGRARMMDWRPEVHDNDGLSMWTSGGERIWRPLVNPRNVRVNSFFDRNPRGFGLLQRDRHFEHYQDDSAFYDLRPSLWVEPLGDWGEGSVRLVEIPTNDEIHDNIVAFWTPKTPLAPRKALSFAYRLHWSGQEPFPADGVARAVATRSGRGGVPGQRRPEGSRKFAIDFTGRPLDRLQRRYDIDPVVTVSRGTVSNGYVVKVVGTDRWRALFDVSDVDGDDPVDLRCFLRLEGETLSETWLYQFVPESG